MNTHRRAWILRAGVVAAMAAAGLVGLASPALADDKVEVQLLNNAFDLQPNASDTLTVRVTNKQPNPDTFEVTVTLPSNVASDVTVSRDGCTNGTSSKCSGVAIGGNGSQDLAFQIKVKAQVSVPPGESRSGSNGQARANSFNGSDQKSFSVTVHGPDQPQVQTVTEVSGVVKDTFAGTAIANATIYLQDSANPPHTYTTSTDKNGKYRFAGSAEKPIVPGIIAVQASKDGFKENSRTATGVAGQSITNLQISLTSNASASATPPTGQAGATTDGQSPLTEEPLGNLSPNEDEGSGLSFVLIAIGALLVLLGIGAIVLLFIKRKHDEDEDDDGPTGPPQRGGRVPPQQRPGAPGRGRRPAPEPTAPMRRAEMADPTAMMRRPEAGAHPGPRDATMIARSPLADAPTMLHGRLPAEHADPYTSPVRPGQQGYGGGGGTGYGSPAPASPPGGGYGGYGPPPSAPINGYGPGGYDQGGYGDQGYADPGYGRQDRGGYQGGQQSQGYGPAGGGYGAPSGGYPDQGYGDQGYDPGYGAQQQQQGGYDPAYDEYEQRPRPRPGGDRRLDWMDD